jgi:hypothetical protein
MGQPFSRERRDRQRTTQKFRRRSETSRVIELIDAQGNREFTRQQGRMSRTKHSKVLSALEKRALRFRSKDQKQADPDKVLFNEAINETGTVSIDGLIDSDDDTIATFITEAAATC